MGAQLRMDEPWSGCGPGRLSDPHMLSPNVCVEALAANPAPTSPPRPPQLRGCGEIWRRTHPTCLPHSTPSGLCVNLSHPNATRSPQEAPSYAGPALCWLTPCLKESSFTCCCGAYVFALRREHDLTQAASSTRSLCPGLRAPRWLTCRLLREPPCTGGEFSQTLTLQVLPVE